MLEFGVKNLNFEEIFAFVCREKNAGDFAGFLGIWQKIITVPALASGKISLSEHLQKFKVTRTQGSYFAISS